MMSERMPPFNPGATDYAELEQACKIYDLNRIRNQRDRERREEFDELLIEIRSIISDIRDTGDLNAYMEDNYLIDLITYIKDHDLSDEVSRGGLAINLMGILKSKAERRDKQELLNQEPVRELLTDFEGAEYESPISQRVKREMKEIIQEYETPKPHLEIIE